MDPFSFHKAIRDIRQEIANEDQDTLGDSNTVRNAQDIFKKKILGRAKINPEFYNGDLSSVDYFNKSLIQGSNWGNENTGITSSLFKKLPNKPRTIYKNNSVFTRRVQSQDKV